MENISNPKKFIEISRKISVKKPIVVFKSGFSQAGQDISESHTGALATEDRVIDAILDKAGAIRANDLEEFLETARILSLFKSPLIRFLLLQMLVELRYRQPMKFQDLKICVLRKFLQAQRATLRRFCRSLFR